MGENQRIVFVKNLRRYMNSRSIEQSDIVSSLGVSASTVSDWVTGKKYPRVDVMQRLADYLGVLLSDLMKEESDDGSLSIPLNPTEAELITIYRELNATGQQTLMNMARSLDTNPDMKRGSKSNTATA